MTAEVKLRSGSGVQASRVGHSISALKSGMFDAVSHEGCHKQA
jgi:hypothetical protein